jgi:hypothetical protein
MFLYPRPKVFLVTLSMSLLFTLPVAAQPSRIKEILRNAPSSRLQFPPHTIGVVIRGASNRVYVVNLKKGNQLQISNVDTGARAGVSVFDKNGKDLTSLSTWGKKDFSYTVPSSGDYYIFGYSGPTNHLYYFTVTAE